MRPIVIAHRTCPRDAPENSLAGIALAGRLGADAVEVDVCLSSDGVPPRERGADAVERQSLRAMNGTW